MLSLNRPFVLSRLEYSNRWEALSMDRCRFRNRDRTQKLRGCKFFEFDGAFEGSLILRYE